MKYGDGTVKGQRLANPRDPATRLALTRACPNCNAEPEQWCSRTRKRGCGRHLSRIHFARCQFRDAP